MSKKNFFRNLTENRGLNYNYNIGLEFRYIPIEKYWPGEQFEGSSA